MPKWEPERLGDRTWLLPTGVNVGLWEEGDGAVLVDSGGDKEAGRQIRQVLEQRELPLRLIVNTHSNADHVGGNAYLQKQTGCRVAATRLESAFVTDPVLEPTFLWGSLPPRVLRGKFLEAAPSAVDVVLPEAGPVAGTALQTVALPGHFFQMVGVLTPDSVLFAGDGLFGQEILDKHPVFFLSDVAGHLRTLDMLEGMDVSVVVPGHGRPVRDKAALISANRAAVHRTSEAITAFCSQPVGFEDILAELCRVFSIELTFQQYVLVGGTLRAFLSWLLDQETLRPSFRGGRMLWERA